DLDGDVEPEFQVRDLGLHHGRVVGRIDLVQFLHALDAGGKEARVAHLGEHRLPRRVDQQVAGEFHDARPLLELAPGGAAKSLAPRGPTRARRILLVTEVFRTRPIRPSTDETAARAGSRAAGYSPMAAPSSKGDTHAPALANLRRLLTEY